MANGGACCAAQLIAQTPQMPDAEAKRNQWKTAVGPTGYLADLPPILPFWVAWEAMVTVLLLVLLLLLWVPLLLVSFPPLLLLVLVACPYAASMLSVFDRMKWEPVAAVCWALRPVVVMCPAGIAAMCLAALQAGELVRGQGTAVGPTDYWAGLPTPCSWQSFQPFSKISSPASWAFLGRC